MRKVIQEVITKVPMLKDGVLVMGYTEILLTNMTATKQQVKDETHEVLTALKAELVKRGLWEKEKMSNLHFHNTGMGLVPCNDSESEAGSIVDNTEDTKAMVKQLMDNIIPALDSVLQQMDKTKDSQPSTPTEPVSLGDKELTFNQLMAIQDTHTDSERNAVRQ